MSVNSVFALGAVGLVFLGTVAGACKRPGARGTPEMSATPNNDSVRNNNTARAISPEPTAEEKRGLGVALAA
jgi:hypothetical protein